MSLVWIKGLIPDAASAAAATGPDPVSLARVTVRWMDRAHVNNVTDFDPSMEVLNEAMIWSRGWGNLSGEGAISNGLFRGKSLGLFSGDLVLHPHECFKRLRGGRLDFNALWTDLQNMRVVHAPPPQRCMTGGNVPVVPPTELRKSGMTLIVCRLVSCDDQSVSE